MSSLETNARNRELRSKRRFDETSSSSNPQRHPWPRPENTPFDGPDYADPKAAINSKECRQCPLSDDWDDYDSLFYNAWLGISIEPTKFLDRPILKKLGIEGDVRDMITQLGLGTMPSRAYDLYPDLVRQFMATVEVIYRTSVARVAGDSTLTFFARGTRYRISISELCRIYGFDESIASYEVPPFSHIEGFWEIVGTGVWDTNRAVLSDIRHTALRYFLRLLANTLVCKMEPNKVRIKELTLLFCEVNAVVDLVELDEDGEVSPPNLGAVFAAHLVELKKKPFTSKGKNKKETVGSLLTLIFQYLGIHLDSCTPTATTPSSTSST